VVVVVVVGTPVKSYTFWLHPAVVVCPSTALAAARRSRLLPEPERLIESVGTCARSATQGSMGR
jgi:hypothetical protein